MDEESQPGGLCDNGIMRVAALPIDQTIFIVIAAGADTEPVTGHLSRQVRFFVLGRRLKSEHQRMLVASVSQIHNPRIDKGYRSECNAGQWHVSVAGVTTARQAYGQVIVERAGVALLVGADERSADGVVRNLRRSN